VDAQWKLKRGAEVDKLTGIERVEFSDYGIALDSEGNAGEAAKLLGVLIGADSLSDRGLVAAVLDYADTGLDLEAMLTIGLDLLLGESPSGSAVVNLLHQALTGVGASPALLADYGGRIDRGDMSAVELSLLAAETDLNSANLDLVGISSNGLAYALSAL
jgi:serralysin